MNGEKQDEIISEFGDDFFRKLYFLCGSEPISPAAIVRRIDKRIIIEYFEKGYSNSFIVRKTGANIRKVQRYREEYDDSKKK